MNNTEKEISDHLRRKLNKGKKKLAELKQKNARQEAIDDWQEHIATLSQVINDVEYGHYKKEQD